MSNGKNPMTALVLRIIVAGYLLYSAYQIWAGEEKSAALTAGAVILAAAGILFGIWAVVQYIRGQKPQDPGTKDS